LLEDFGGLAEEHQLMEEHEEYLISLVSMESYYPKAQELPSTRIFETIEHSHMHGNSRARGSYEDTSICVPGVVDLHVEVDPVVHPGPVMLQEYTRYYMSMQEHTMVSDSTQRHVEVYGGIQRDVLDCREETHLVEHGDASPLQQHIVLRDHLHGINNCMRDEGWRVVDQQLEDLPPIVPDDWGSMMTTDEYLPWVSVDETFVESLGLTKAYDTFQSYS
jgi:hypothetical protein